MKEVFFDKPRKIKAADWYVNSYAKDIWKMAQDPAMGSGDGKIYVVRDIFKCYISQVWDDGTIATTTDTRLKFWRKFYDGQAAWGAARRLIYPARIFIIGKVV